MIAEPRARLFAPHALFLEARFPIIERAFPNRETRRNDLSNPAAAAPPARPREKCDRRPRPAGSIPEIQVIGRRIVEVDGAFHQAQAEHARIKIHVPLRITGDRGDMVNAAQLHRREANSFSASYSKHVLVAPASDSEMVDRKRGATTRLP